MKFTGLCGLSSRVILDLKPRPGPQIFMQHPDYQNTKGDHGGSPYHAMG